MEKIKVSLMYLLTYQHQFCRYKTIYDLHSTALATSKLRSLKGKNTSSSRSLQVQISCVSSESLSQKSGKTGEKVKM